MAVSASSRAYIAVTMFSAVFDDVYGRDGGIPAIGLSGAVCNPIEPTSLDTFTIRPDADRRSSGRNAFVTAITPNTLVSYTSRIASSGVPLGSDRLVPVIPALFTRMSSWPYSASVQAAAFRTLSSLTTSSSTERASAPPSRNATSAAWPSASSRAPTSTVTPAAPSWRAVSNPIPLFAPVIRAIFVVVMAVTLGVR